MDTTRLFFDAIKSELDGTVLPIRDGEYDITQLTGLAKAHDLMNLISDALYRANALPKDGPSSKEIYRQTVLYAAARVEKVHAMYEIARQTLIDAQVDFIPLKGAVLRPMYPETWMRTSCDIDILVREPQLEQAVGALKQKGFTTNGKRNFHDVSLFYYGSHLELHFSILESAERFDPLLSRVWDYVAPVSEYEYRMTPEFFAFHHLAHMAHHLFSGGCGIRPFVDLYLMRQKNYYDEQKLLAFLEQCDLLKFYDGILAQIDVWFNGAPYDWYTEHLEAYVFHGGVFGKEDMFLAARTAKNNGKLSNMIVTAFPPYFNMQQFYPKLRHKWQLPYYYTARLCRKLFGESRTRAWRKIRGVVRQDQSEVETVSRLLDHLQLKNKMSEIK